MDNKSKTWDESLNKQPNCSSYDTIDHYTKVNNYPIEKES